MPDSEAVYQPTTVGYTYDAGGDGNETVNGLRNGFSRIIFRNKVSTRKWAEWVLLSVAICATVAGLTMLVVQAVADANRSEESDSSETTPKDPRKDAQVENHTESNSGGSVAVGVTIMFAGFLMGCGWAWLRFFHRSKSPRGGMARGSGQMLGGLNPSTDLLVGSTSQYGPVLTEVPSQMMPAKTTGTHDPRVVAAAASALSDQEEETRTLMPDNLNAAAPNASLQNSVEQSPNVIAG